MDNGHGLSKRERLCSRKAIDALFSCAGSMSLSVYPIRAVFRHTEEAGTRILVSVSKKRFRHAVDRNRVKRQLREQYRLHKDILAGLTRPGNPDWSDQSDQSDPSPSSDRSAPPAGGMDLALIWLTDRLQPSSIVEEKMMALLGKISQAAATRPSTETTE